MSQFLARMLLLALAFLTAVTGSAQPSVGQPPPDPVPPYTAFPELTAVEYQDKTVPLPDGGTQIQRVPRNPIVVPALPAAGANEAPLQKVRRAQARAGLLYLARVAQAVQILGPDPDDYDNNLRMEIETYRVAAELEDRPIRRVPWYEARVRALKESERYTLLRVKAGALRPELFHLVCFARLHAEADLLVLKAAIAASETGPNRMPEPRRPALLDEPTAAPKPTPQQRTETAYTAFPDLKPPTVRFEQTPNGTKEIEEGRVPLPPLVVVPEDAPPLLRARRARANEGLTYLVRVEAAHKIVGPDPYEYQNDRTFAARTFLAAAELEPRLPDRVPWYEARIRTYKEVERYTDLRVEAGALKPQRRDQAQFQRLAAELDLLVLQTAIANLDASTPGPAVGREPFASDKVRPEPEPKAFTAFPDLKPLSRPPADSSGQKRIDELLAGTKPLTPAPDETPLQRVRRERVLCGIAFLTRVEAARAIFGPNPANFLVEQAFVAEVCRAAAEREPNRTDGVAWHEIRVRLLKESEEATGRSVQGGALRPQRLDQARFDRLEAEIDLLLLKAENDASAAPAMCSPSPGCVQVCGPRVRARGGLLSHFRLCR